MPDPKDAQQEPAAGQGQDGGPTAQDQGQVQAQAPEPAPAPQQDRPKPQPNGDEGDFGYWKARARDWERKAKAANREVAVLDVARKAGVDPDILGRMAGSKPEEIEANAQMLKERMGDAAATAAAAAAPNPYPEVPDLGASAPCTTTREEISKIRNPQERIMARAENLGLYD